MKSLLVSIIRLYKSFISPVLLSLFGNGCRFTPTCSTYTIDAIEKYGVLKGSILGIKRFLRCNPFGDSGYDPVK